MKFIFTQLKDVEEHLTVSEVSPLRKELLERVKTYLESGEFTSYKKFDTLLSVRFASSDLQAKVLDVNPTNLRRIKSQVTQEALAVIGDKTFDIIMYGSEAEVKRLLRDLPVLFDDSCSETLFSLNLLEKVKLVGVDATTAYPVSDCKPELALLYWLCNTRLPELLSNVDIDRVAFLLRCINRTGGTKEDRLEIMRVLLADDLFKHLKSEDKKLFSFPPVREDEYF